jgi:hypothetical protein
VISSCSSDKARRFPHCKTASQPSLQVEGWFSLRLLVESGWKLSQTKENRLEEKLSHHHHEGTNEREQPLDHIA